jgi:hypothetical protein
VAVLSKVIIFSNDNKNINYGVNLIMNKIEIIKNKNAPAKLYAEKHKETKTTINDIKATHNKIISKLDTDIIFQFPSWYMV